MIFKIVISSIIGAILAVITNIYIFDVRTLFNFDTDIKIHQRRSNTKLFTVEKLSQFNGNTREQLYLSILGSVYDVTKGRKHYGPGETYHAFVGRDASQAFITGDFSANNLSDDVSKLSGEELLSLEKWKEFYDKEYIKRGLLIGRFYDSNGAPTEYLLNIEKNINEARLQKSLKADVDKIFPPCNIEWDAERGTRVWCSNKSGGIERDWVGYPVKLFEPGSTSYRCACVKSYDQSLSLMIKLYDDCNLKSSCYVKIND